MKYFYLLHLLPADIVHYIYLIILKKNAVNTIIHNFKLSNFRYTLINKSIEFITIFDHYESIISDDYVSNFNWILNHKYPLKYDKEFWQHFINLFIIRLMRIHWTLKSRGFNMNNNKYYINYKKSINFIFELSKKYNIKFRFYKYNFRDKNSYWMYYDYAKNMNKFEDFSKYKFSPSVVNTNSYEYYTYNHNDSLNYFFRLERLQLA